MRSFFAHLISIKSSEAAAGRRRELLAIAAGSSRSPRGVTGISRRLLMTDCVAGYVDAAVWTPPKM